MVTQQLLDYISEETRRGISKEQIKQTLLANNWSASDVEEALNPTSTKTPTRSSTPPRIKMIRIILAIIFVAGLSVGAYLFLFKKSAKAPVTMPEQTQQPVVTAGANTSETRPETVFNPTSNQTAPETIKPLFTSTSAGSEEQPITISRDQNVVLADKLKTCSKYLMTYQNPMYPMPLTKEVVGMVENKCNYSEQLPGGGNMDCRYTESERLVVAQFYKDMALTNFTSSTKKNNLITKKKYTFDGTSVNSPVQAALQAGVCTVTQ